MFIKLRQLLFNNRINNKSMLIKRFFSIFIYLIQLAFFNQLHKDPKGHWTSAMKKELAYYVVHALAVAEGELVVAGESAEDFAEFLLAFGPFDEEAILREGPMDVFVDLVRLVLGRFLFCKFFKFLFA